MLDILEKKLTENQTTRKGLTTAEAEKRLSTDGENRLAKKKKTSAAKIFAGQFHDVMVMILLVSVVISVALGQYADAVPIVLIVIINAALGFIQEYRCEKTLEKLENMTGYDIFSKAGMDREEASEFIKNIYRNAVENNAAKMMRHIDISVLVEEKVRSMEISELEDMVMSMMKKELNSVVRLGALLGFVIGFINVFI